MRGARPAGARRGGAAASPAALAVAVVVVLGLSGCSDQLGDRETGAGRDADRIGDVGRVVVYRDADDFPNVARICVDGLGFSSTSSGPRAGDDKGDDKGDDDRRAAPALVRVPEWDARCRNVTKNAGDS